MKITLLWDGRPSAPTVLFRTAEDENPKSELQLAREEWDELEQPEAVTVTVDAAKPK